MVSIFVHVEGSTVWLKVIVHILPVISPIMALLSGLRLRYGHYMFRSNVFVFRLESLKLAGELLPNRQTPCSSKLECVGYESEYLQLITVKTSFHMQLIKESFHKQASQPYLIWGCFNLPVGLLLLTLGPACDY